MKIKKNDKNNDWMWNSLYGVDSSFKYAGHYKDKPVFTRDDVPKNMIYFLNDDFLVDDRKKK